MLSLIKAIANERKDKIKDIIAKGFHINSYFRVGRERTTALMYAASLGKVKSVQQLLNLGADVHIGNDTPLMLAAKNGFYQTVVVLLQHGANATAQDGKAFFFAMRYEKFNIFKALKRDTEHKDIMNRCKLVLACMNGDTATVQHCIENGADLHTWHDLALRQAIHGKHKETTAYLIQQANYQVSKEILHRLQMRKWTKLLQTREK